MKLKRLYIGDMGIYRNALMDNISPKIVVIGGLNRSGKTTLLEILRHMAYGFPKDLRETRTEYFVEGDYINEQNKQCTVKLAGQREPQISFLQEDEPISSKELYGGVDKFTYSQLFTITLDELRKSNVKNEEEKLQAVLLGAGLKDIVHIPKLIEEFRKEKEKIGGKQGNPSTKLFKPYYDKLLKDISDREEALSQLEEYEDKCLQLKRLEEQINELDKELISYGDKVTVLEVVKAHYRQHSEKRNLELQLEGLSNRNVISLPKDFPSMERIEALKEEYKEALVQYERLKDYFEGSVTCDRSFYDRLLQQKDRIRSFQKQLSGFYERIENFKNMKARFEQDKETLQISMNSLNSSWKGDFSKVCNIDCDSLEQDSLIALIDEFNVCDNEKKQTENALDNLKLQKGILEEQKRGFKASDSGVFIKKYLYNSLSIFLAGVLLYIISKPLGGALTLAGVVSVSLYYISRYSADNQLQKSEKSLLLQLSALENSLKLEEEKLKRASSNLNTTKQKLDFYKNKLEIYKEVSPVGLLQYFKEIKELKRNILNLDYTAKGLNKLYEEVELDLMKVNELVSRVTGEKLFSNEQVYKNSRELCVRVEELSQQMEQAEKLADCENKLCEFENRLRTLLNIAPDSVILDELDKFINHYRINNQYNYMAEEIEIINNQLVQILSGERLKKAFVNACREFATFEESSLKGFERLFDNYSTEEQAVRELDECSRNLKEALDRLEGLKEKKQDLNSEIKVLRASEKLIDSQRAIDEQRAALKQLAIKYSVYSAAEYMLENVQRDFMDNAKDTILGGAGNIFNKITGGQYKALLPGENLLQTDFKAMLEDGQVQNSVSLLSRGTGEQLYLSVRLNRIMEMREKLPLILDDPFVNFDCLHVKNTLKVISETASDNQIFILTCHSELVKLIDNISKDVQYWKLKDGNFQLSDCKELKNYLL